MNEFLSGVRARSWLHSKQWNVPAVPRGQSDCVLVHIQTVQKIKIFITFSCFFAFYYCSLYIKLTYVMNNEHTGIYCPVFPIENILVRIQIPCLIILKLRIIKVLLKHNLPFLYKSGNFYKQDLIKSQRLSQEMNQADFVPLDTGTP